MIDDGSPLVALGVLAFLAYAGTLAILTIAGRKP